MPKNKIVILTILQLRALQDVLEIEMSELRNCDYEGKALHLAQLSRIWTKLQNAI